jgi:hypothetical protein
MEGLQRKYIFPKVPVPVLSVTTGNKLVFDTSISVTVDICLNKPVTREVPYWLLSEHPFRNMPFKTYHNINK